MGAPERVRGPQPLIGIVVREVEVKVEMAAVTVVEAVWEVVVVGVVMEGVAQAVARAVLVVALDAAAEVVVVNSEHLSYAVPIRSSGCQPSL